MAAATLPDSTVRPPYVGRSALKLASTSWSVAAIPSVLPGSGGTLQVYRDRKTRAGAISADSLLLVLPPALRSTEEPDPHTDTAWTWLVPNGTQSPWLLRDSATVAVDTVVTTPAQTVRWELDSLYYYGDRGLPFNNSTEETSGEGWYWSRLRAGSTVTVGIGLPWFTATGEASGLRLRLHSSSPPAVTPTHAIAVLVNGQSLDTLRWNGYQTLIGSVNVPTAILLRGTNNVQLRSLATGASVNEVYIDWFELTAPQEVRPSGASLRLTPPSSLTGRRVRFQVEASAQDPVTVLRTLADGSLERWPASSWNGSTWEFTDTVLTGRSFLITRSSDILRPNLPAPRVVPDLTVNPAGADHVIIAPRAYAVPAQRLAAHRSLHDSLRTAVVLLEDILDAFGEGRWGPVAIRSFLLTIDTSWTAPAPSSVLLLGDGTWDPLDHLRTGKRGIIPTLGNPVSDAMFIVDTLDRFRSRKAIGRLPVHTLAQADSIVDALIAYDAQPITDWNRRFLFFASGFDPLETLRFQQYSDQLFTTHLAPGPLAGTQAKIYRTVNEVIDFEQTEEVRRTLDSGAVWINYYGHAGTDVWANGINRADQLNNAEEKAHLITDISCSTARFGEPLVESFGEMMVRSTTARALAYVGSSGFGFETPLRVLAQGFFKAFAQGERRLGALHLAAKQELWKGGTSSLTTQQALHQWTLLGDPSARLRIARWTEFDLDARTLTVLPTEPTEEDSNVTVRCEIRNIGLLTADSVVVRLRVITETMDVSFDTTLPASQRSRTIAWDRAVLSTPGIHTVTVSVNPDSSLAEESRTRNEAEIRYVVSSSRFLVLEPTEFSRRHPDSVRVVVLPPQAIAGSPTLEVEVDTTAGFDSAWRQRWSGIPMQPYATEFSIPAGSLTSGGRYLVRARIAVDATTSPWITRTISTGTSTSWQQDDISGWTGTEVAGVMEGGSWRLEERSVPIRVFSAGFSDGLDASIWLGGVDVSQGFVTRGYNVAVVDEKSGGLEAFAGFSLYSDPADTMFAEPLIQFIQSIPAGRRVLVGVADEGQRNKTERLNRALESIGSGMIRSLGFRGSWAISGWKGAPIGSVPEARSNENQGAVTVFDTLEVRADTGRVLSPVIGPASGWTGILASIDDTGSTAHVQLSAIRIPVAGQADTVAISAGSVLANWPPGISSVRLMADMWRMPGSASPVLRSWSVKHTGLAEAAISASTARMVQDSVDAGIPLRFDLPVKNVGSSAIESLEVRVRWRWPTGEVTTNFRLHDLGNGSADTVRAELSTGSIRGPVDIEAVLDPDFQVHQWDRGNDILRRAAFVFADTVRPRFQVLVDGRAIVDGDFVRPNPEIQVEIADDGAVPIASASFVDIRLDGRRVALATGTPDSSFESRWSERKAIVKVRPAFDRGAHVLSVQATDGSGNLADSSAFELTMKVETEPGILHLLAYPNPFITDTDITFHLTGQAMPDEGSIRLYTVAGRLIREIELLPGTVQTGFNVVGWDGRDADGDEVSNGVYLAVLKVRAAGVWHQETAKLARIR